MGLVVTAYAQVEIVKGIYIDPDSYDESNYVYTDSLLEFPKQGKGLEPYSFYTFKEKQSFAIGSCSTYDTWRGYLIDFAKGTDSFNELIHFSDCEGFIGPNSCTKLYTDFTENQQKIQHYYNIVFKDVPPFFNTIGMTTYLVMLQAFKLASNNGMVRFC